MALLVGFVLDQQVTVQKAFAGPLAIRERLGAFDVDTLASADSSPCSAPGPRSTATPGRWRSGCTTSRSMSAIGPTGGDAARVWTDAADSDEAAHEPGRAARLR